jgi:hypothetical protein
VRLAGLTPEQWSARWRINGRLYVDLADEDVAALTATCPTEAERIVRAAERILRHEFDLLGSGSFVPVDRARSSRAGYVPIDWYLDPIRQLRFSERVPYKEWNLATMRPGTADVKLPWELARSHHWVTLGQAYRLTRDERFAAEVLREHADFREASPVGFGIHWTCTMDVAIRAYNWALALELIRRSPSAADSAIEEMCVSLFEHAVFIEHNLENTYEVTSNHFLSNVVGLYGLARVFHDLPIGARWNGLCREWLEAEMEAQVLDDGADYESSVPYHRLVTELFLAAWRLAHLDHRPLSDRFRTKLRAMVEFLAAVLRPDGLLPQVGDADDGRLHIFTDGIARNPQDGRHLLAAAGGVFGEPEWLAAAGSAARWEAAWWGTQPDLAAPTSETSPRRAGDRGIARLFPDAGLAVVRDRDVYLLVTNGVVGTSGFGNHKHNDQLGFELHVGGVALIVDAGSYVYTSDPEARNLFRSTRYHNTVGVDGAEQNELRPELLFRLFESARPEHVAFRVDSDHAVYCGRHSGYTRLDAPVVHEREFRLRRSSASAEVSADPWRGSLSIIDRFSGSGSHRFTWHFHAAPGVDLRRCGARVFELSIGGIACLLTLPSGVLGDVSDAWYSPSYGVRIPCRALDLQVDERVHGHLTFEFLIAPVMPR